MATRITEFQKLDFNFSTTDGKLPRTPDTWSIDSSMEKPDDVAKPAARNKLKEGTVFPQTSQRQPRPVQKEEHISWTRHEAYVPPPTDDDKDESPGEEVQVVSVAQVAKLEKAKPVGTTV
jgi:hypothetical protein